MNILKEILKKFPETKIEIIANDKKNQYIADQMADLINWHNENENYKMPKNGEKLQDLQ